MSGKEAVATTDANPRARGPRTTRPRPGPGRAKPTAADDNHPGPPDPADTARVPTNAQRAIVARWSGPGVGGEELGNLKDSELELEDLEKEKNRFYNLYYYYRGLSKPELEVWAPSPSHWQTILSPGYLHV